MPIDGETLERLEAHERHSAARAQTLEAELKRLEGIAMGHTDNVRDDVNVHNIFEGLKGGGGGGNWGAIGLAGLLPLLFGRRGLGGIEEGGGGGGETRLQDTVFNTAVLSKLGEIEASIPFNEAQVQLALANQTSDLTQIATANANASALATGLVKDAVNSAALLQQNSASQILQAIANGVTTVTSKIDGGTIANLQAELAEERGRGRSREVEVNVSQNVNQNQMQQQQQQQMASIMATLAGLTQIAHATNSNIIAGNTGAVTTAAQTANPTNIRA